MTKYLKETDKCQPESYYECLATQLDTVVECNECSDKCIPNAFSNLGKVYKSPFCQNDTENEKCALRIINQMQEQEIGTECQKACSSLEYFGEVTIIRPCSSGYQSWNLYHFSYFLSNQDFAAKVYAEYLIYDTIGMIGSVGGTLGIFIRL